MLALLLRRILPTVLNAPRYSIPRLPISGLLKYAHTQKRYIAALKDPIMERHSP